MFNIFKKRYATEEELKALKKVYSIVAERDELLEFAKLAIEKIESLTKENEFLKKDKQILEKLLNSRKFKKTRKSNKLSRVK